MQNLYNYFFINLLALLVKFNTVAIVLGVVNFASETL